MPDHAHASLDLAQAPAPSGVASEGEDSQGALKMSKAVIDFCQGLQTALLGLEDRLAKAKAALNDGRANVESEAKHHIEEAGEQLETFKLRAAALAAEIRAELPEKVDVVEDKLKEAGLEAQVALRHAVVFLAEAASKGATGAAALLHRGAERAQGFAETLRHETAVTVRESEPDRAQGS